MNVNHIYIKEGATLRYWLRGAFSCGVMDDVRESCVPAVSAPALGVLPDAVCGAGMRPQGGGGVDHPTKVQQNKAQTEIRSLSFVTSSFFHSIASFSCECCHSLLYSFACKAPGAITTLKSNLCGFVIGFCGVCGGTYHHFSNINRLIF